MCSVARGSTTRPPSPRTSVLVRFTVSSTLSSRGVAASSSGRWPAIVSVRRERCRTPPRYRPASLRVSASMSPISLKSPKQSSCRSTCTRSLVGLSVVTTWCSSTSEMAGSVANVAGPRVRDARAEYGDPFYTRIPVSARARLLAPEAARYPATLLRGAAPRQLRAVDVFEGFEVDLREPRSHPEAAACPVHLAILREMPRPAHAMFAITSDHVRHLDDPATHVADDLATVDDGILEPLVSVVLADEALALRPRLEFDATRTRVLSPHEVTGLD